MVDDTQRARYTTVGQAFLAKVAQRLANLDPETLSPAELARWADVALKLQEAGARGETYDRATRLRSIEAPDVVRNDPDLNDP